MPRAQNENLKPVWNGLLIVMSLYVAFSIGANNVANAAGPIASMTANELNISGNENFILIMILSTLIVAPSFGIGSSIFGHKIVKKIQGKKLCCLENSKLLLLLLCRPVCCCLRP